MTATLQEQLNRGAKLLQTGQVEEALELARELLSQYQGHQAVHLFAADASSLNGYHKAAIECLDVIPNGQRHPAVLVRKAELLFSTGQRRAALETARAAAEIVGSDESQLRSVARLYTDCQDLEGARALLLQAQERLPDSPQILYDLALSEFHLNLPEEAERHIDLLLQTVPAHAGALHLRSAVRTQSAERNHIDDLQERLRASSQPGNLVAAANFALAKEYEDLARYEESFTALEKGTSAYRQMLSYDGKTELASHAGIRKQFTPQAYESLSAGFEDKSPVFVIGMPRTGTTLVERMLSSHSQVMSLGEFTDFPRLLTEMIRAKAAELGSVPSGQDLTLSLDFDQLGERYVASARQIAGDSPRFVDKLPYNFLYCGYIAASLPNAKLIHLTRDPLDTCYAVYKTLFFRAYSYSYRLDELADYYISYRKHMQHWHEVLPGRIIDVNYEQLVQAPEEQARRIVSCCDLPWEDAVLDFHAQESPAMTASAMQVRNPVNTQSIGAWRRAGGSFNRLRERLQEAGLVS
ncbi:MAG: sulfotransferase [Pseudomonadota bacterium]